MNTFLNENTYQSNIFPMNFNYNNIVLNFRAQKYHQKEKNCCFVSVRSFSIVNMSLSTTDVWLPPHTVPKFKLKKTCAYHRDVRVSMGI